MRKTILEAFKNEIEKNPYKADVYQMGVILLLLAAVGPVSAQWQKMI